jgi:hypothetical protein
MAGTALATRAPGNARFSPVVTRLRKTNPVASHRLAQDPLSAAARREVAVGRLTVAAISDGVLVMSPTMVGSPVYPTGAHDEIAAQYGEASCRSAALC